MTDILDTFLKAANEFAEKLNEPKQDAYWDRLLEILGLGPNGTKAEVIDLVKELALSRGYAKLKADNQLEQENEQLKRQVSALQSELRRQTDVRNDVRNEAREIISAFMRQHDRFILDLDNKLSEL